MGIFGLSSPFYKKKIKQEMGTGIRNWFVFTIIVITSFFFQPIIGVILTLIHLYFSFVFYNSLSSESKRIKSTYYPNGQLRFKNTGRGTKIRGIPGNPGNYISEYTEYFENGNIKFYRESNSHNKIILERYYSENGKLNSEERWDEDIKSTEDSDTKKNKKITKESSNKLSGDNNKNIIMKITTETIISSICGTSSNITFEEFSKQLLKDGEGYVGDEEIQELMDDGNVYLFEGYCYFSEEDNNTIGFYWEGIEDCGMTKFLNNIFKETYLLRIDEVIYYGDHEYIEIRIYDQNEPILENVVNSNRSELSVEEKKLYDKNIEEYQNHEIEMYSDRCDKISLIKKSEFNKDNIEGQSI